MVEFYRIGVRALGLYPDLSSVVIASGEDRAQDRLASGSTVKLV